MDPPHTSQPRFALRVLRRATPLSPASAYVPHRPAIRAGGKTSSAPLRTIAFAVTLATSFAAMTIPATAQTTVASYLFTGGSSNATTVASNASASAAAWVNMANANVGFSSGNNDAFARYDAVGVPSFNSTRYFEITLTATPGFFLSLSNISFDIGVINSSGVTAAITRTSSANARTSVDSFSNNLSMTPGSTNTARASATGPSVTTYSNYSIALADPSYSGLTNFTFRLYPFVSATNANSSFLRFDDIILLGTVDIATYVWTAGSGAWSLAGDWSDSRPGVDNGLMIFSGGGGASTNDSVSNIRGLVFSNGAGSYTVSGNDLTLSLSSAGITNNSGNVQTVLNNLTLATNAVVSATSGAVVLGGTIDLGTNNLVFASTGAITNNGRISGTGGLTKSGGGMLTLSGNNTFSGAVSVQAGTLELAGTEGSTAGGSASTVAVESGAVLLLSQSSQFNSAPAVTLSGGTISRGVGVSEVFGSLNVTSASFLEFGTGNAGSITAGNYTKSAILTLNNFFPGNTFTFTSGDFSSGDVGDYFAFSGSFQNYSLSNTGSTFTITAIPEPSTWGVAAGLFAVLISPLCRRLLKRTGPVHPLRPSGRAS